MLNLTLRPNSDIERVVWYAVDHGNTEYGDLYKMVNEEVLDLDTAIHNITIITGGVYSMEFGLPNHTTEHDDIASVIVYVYIAKEWMGNPVNYKCYLFMGSTDNKVEIFPTGNNTLIHAHFPLNPSGGAWTWEDVDSATVGILVTATPDVENNTLTRCYQMWVTVVYKDHPTLSAEDPVIEHTKVSATVTGEILNIGNDAVTRRGVCYVEGTSGDPTITDSIAYTDGSFSIGEFTQVIPSLDEGTSYRVRTYATNSEGTGYGTTVQMATDAPADGMAGTASWLNIPYYTSSNAEFRGVGVFNDKAYIVVGSNVLILTPAGLTTAAGSLTTSTGRVFLAYNGTQVLIVDGTAAGHYITISDGSLNNITDDAFPAATSCCFMDSYFIVTEEGTGAFYISGVYNAATWDILDKGVAEGDPDIAIRCFHANGNLWIFGKQTTEVWYNSGNADFPFNKITGALIEDGLAGVDSVAFIKDQFYFLSHKFEVLRTLGYQREKVSTTYIDDEIQGYTTKSDATIYEYRAFGHIFVVLVFPTEDKTWVYDITTDLWHEWQSYKTQGVATYGRHRGSVGFYLGGKYLVGDHTNGNIYELDLNTYTDNGELIPRTRRGQIINKERKRVAHHEVDIDFEFGVGAGGVNNPAVYLCWSDDNGNTWSNKQRRNLGELTQYQVRTIWRRLGMSRNRIYELTMIEPVRFILLGAYAELEEESK